jgi:hypothetical protein
MAYTPISNLPTPPSRQDPANFSGDADSFLGALPTFQTEVNAAGEYIDSKAAEVDVDATAAADSADTAQAAADSAFATVSATAWVSGASYAEGDAVWSLVNYQTYRAITAHSGETTDPSLDTTNWLALADFVKRSGDTMTGDLEIDGEIRANVISDKDGTGPISLNKQNAAKLWSRFSTDASITVSGLNVASATDLGVGKTSVSFTNAFDGTNYAPHATVLTGTESSWVAQITSLASTSVTVHIIDELSNFSDKGFSISMSGDLA